MVYGVVGEGHVLCGVVGKGRVDKRKSIESGYKYISYSPAVWPEEKQFEVVVTYIWTTIKHMYNCGR